MAEYKMVENEEVETCLEHQRRMKAVNISPDLQKDKRILCEFCAININHIESIIGLDLIKSQIENKLKYKRQELYIRMNNIIQKIDEFKEKVNSKRKFVLTQFDIINSSLESWQNQSYDLYKKLFQYSLFEEVQQISNKKDNELYKKNFIDQIILNNNSFQEKIRKKMEEFPNILDMHTILKEIVNYDFSLCCDYKQKKIQIEESMVRINIFGNLIEQKEQCRAIVFNKQGSIMVSTFDKQIKIWGFLKGVLKQVQILSGHEQSVQCLYFSKLNNYFISSSDQTIKVWVLADTWICKQTVNMNKASITCIVTDLKEKLIIFGCNDNSIQVWQLNDQYNLKKRQDLFKHDRQVNTLSLNQSETILVSCADDSAQDKNQIIVWEKTQSQQIPFQFKYFVRQISEICGPQISFINNEQFVLINENTNIVQLFEDCRGELLQNFEKDVNLTAKGNSERLFPILYNIQKQLLYFKIKQCIYILNSNLQLQSFLKSNGMNIQGCVTNDGQYLVYWDEKNKGYSIFTISYL